MSSFLSFSSAVALVSSVSCLFVSFLPLLHFFAHSPTSSECRFSAASTRSWSSLLSLWSVSMAESRPLVCLHPSSLKRAVTPSPSSAGKFHCFPQVDRSFDCLSHGWREKELRWANAFLWGVELQKKEMECGNRIRSSLPPWLMKARAFEHRVAIWGVL